MTGEFLIRRARLEDREAVGRLWMMLLKEQAVLDPRFEAAEDALRRWHNDFSLWVREETRRIFMAEQAREATGFISAHLWQPPPIYEPGLEIYIDELFVRPVVRRQGQGARLVEEVRRWALAQGARRLRLGMLAANTAGQAFWTRQQARPFAVTMTVELEGGASASPSEISPARFGF